MVNIIKICSLFVYITYRSHRLLFKIECCADEKYLIVAKVKDDLGYSLIIKISINLFPILCSLLNIWIILLCAVFVT
jgi:hypothetical protein